MSEDEYIEHAPRQYIKRGSNLTEYNKKRGASSDPKKCRHPDDRGRNCSYCGVYIRGDDMG